MGLIDSSIDDDFAKAKPTAARMEAGPNQEVTIAQVEIVADKTKIKRTWVDVELVVTFQNEAGAKAWHHIELAPLTDKDGNVSPGKLGFVKSQLEAMGFLGKLSELEYQVNGLLGAKVRINVNDVASTKLNPKTNKPYVNREIYANELIAPGVGGSTGAQAVAEDFVPAPEEDDDDIPF